MAVPVRYPPSLLRRTSCSPTAPTDEGQFDVLYMRIGRVVGSVYNIASGGAKPLTAAEVEDIRLVRVRVWEIFEAVPVLIRDIVDGASDTAQARDRLDCMWLELHEILRSVYTMFARKWAHRCPIRSQLLLKHCRWCATQVPSRAGELTSITQTRSARPPSKEPPRLVHVLPGSRDMMCNTFFIPSREGHNDEGE